jgi:hypothetical protein
MNELFEFRTWWMDTAAYPIGTITDQNTGQMVYGSVAFIMQSPFLG